MQQQKLRNCKLRRAASKRSSISGTFLNLWYLRRSWGTAIVVSDRHAGSSHCCIILK